MKRDSFWKGKKVLITGANGFLGSHLSLAVLKKGAFVAGLIKERVKDSFLDAGLKGADKTRIKIKKADIVDLKTIVSLFKEEMPDICFHLAAQPIVGVANQSPLATLETNIKGTWNILEAARLCQTRALVVASSDKAYGEHKKLPYREDSALLALHPYDVSKACADMLARCYARTYALNTAITRCSNIYGPGDQNFSRIVPDTVRSALLGLDPVIRSDGTPLRDYIFVDDVVCGYLLLGRSLFEGKVKPGEAFNFGTRKPIRVLSLVNKILRICGKNDLKPRILSKKKIHGEIDRQFLSSEKAKRKLGWVCRYSLEMGLKRTIKWYKKSF